jgi:hypothetical protein
VGLVFLMLCPSVTLSEPLLGELDRQGSAPDHQCCGLDLEYSPKAHILETWSPAWHYWEMVDPLRGGSWWAIFR